jgi:hypothetical protein
VDEQTTVRVREIETQCKRSEVANSIAYASQLVGNIKSDPKSLCTCNTLPYNKDCLLCRVPFTTGHSVATTAEHEHRRITGCMIYFTMNYTHLHASVKYYVIRISSLRFYAIYNMVGSTIS